MRRPIATFPVISPGAATRIHLFGPNGRLSGVDNTRIAAVGLVGRYAEAPRYQEQGYQCAPHQGLVEHAGYQNLGYQEHGHQELELPVAVRAHRRWEYGVIPFGAKLYDDEGGVTASLPESTVFINDSPQPAAAAEISVASDRVTITLAEWADG